MFKRMLLALTAVMLLALMPTTTALAQYGAEGPPAAATDAEPGQLAQGEAHQVGGHDKPPLLPDPTARETQLQALWTVIIFVILLAILYPTAWKNVLAGLKAREQRIRGDIADAEAARLKAEATLRQYNQQLAEAEHKFQERIAQAGVEAERIAAAIKANAQKDVEEMRDRAGRDIDAARNAALAEIYQKTAELSTSIAEKIIRRNLNPEDQRDLVNRSLEELQTVAAR